MNRRRAAVALVVVAAAVAAYRLHFAGWSDEDRIRAMVQEIQKGFNRGSASAVSRPLSADFTVEGTPVGRDEVHAFLAHFFLTSKDPRTGEPALHVEVERAGIQIEIDPQDPFSAGISVPARFSHRAGTSSAGPGGATLLFQGHLTCREGRWRISRASCKIEAGRWPF